MVYQQYEDSTSQTFRNGEENLHESSEKKGMKADSVPKSGAIKTGTHLGQGSQSKNIFLNKFVCNSTKNQKEMDNKQAKFDFEVPIGDSVNDDKTPRIETKTLERQSKSREMQNEIILKQKMDEAARQIGQVSIDTLHHTKTSTIRGVSQGPPVSQPRSQSSNRL